MADKAIFGAGCFWGVEETFRKVPGVTETVVGYSGGNKDNPSYEEVCSGRTGHTEVLQVEYDPNRVTYEDLLQVFWDVHDPTQLNRQGPDVGTQYRSAIYTASPEQETAARASKEALDSGGGLPQPVVTEIAPAGQFWPAEDYHQRYIEKRMRQTFNLG